MPRIFSGTLLCALFMALWLVTGSVASAQSDQRFEPSERTVDGPYPVPEPLNCNARWGSVACVGIDALPSEDVFTAEVRDAHGQPVYVRVVTEDGARVGNFCGQTTQPLFFEPGARLEFLIEPAPSFFSHWGVGWVGPLDCPYRVATIGTIRVTLSGWTISEESTSPGASDPPDPQSSPSGESADVERSVNLSLRGHLRGVGSVVVPEPSCRSDVPVVIQKRRSDAWVEIASTTTDVDGTFALRLTDRSGRYRAVAPEVGISETTCLTATSPTVRHQH